MEPFGILPAAALKEQTTMTRPDVVGWLGIGTLAFVTVYFHQSPDLGGWLGVVCIAFLALERVARAVSGNRQWPYLKEQSNGIHGAGDIGSGQRAVADALHRPQPLANSTIPMPHRALARLEGDVAPKKSNRSLETAATHHN
jgi:hypothetical protein